MFQICIICGSPVQSAISLVVPRSPGGPKNGSRVPGARPAASVERGPSRLAAGGTVRSLADALTQSSPTAMLQHRPLPHLPEQPLHDALQGFISDAQEVRKGAVFPGSPCLPGPVRAGKGAGEHHPVRRIPDYVQGREDRQETMPGCHTGSLCAAGRLQCAGQGARGGLCGGGRCRSPLPMCPPLPVRAPATAPRRSRTERQGGAVAGAGCASRISGP